jgi:hypothetical protein
VRQELKKLSPEFAEEDRVYEQLRAEQLVPLMLAEDLQELLIRRVAPLSGENRLSPFIRDAGDPPEWPLVTADKLKPLPAVVDVFAGWPNGELALLAAAVHGELSPRLRAQLTAAGVKVNETLDGRADPVSAPSRLLAWTGPGRRSAERSRPHSGRASGSEEHPRLPSDSAPV